jgi:hypothetical protein
MMLPDTEALQRCTLAARDKLPSARGVRQGVSTTGEFIRQRQSVHAASHDAKSRIASPEMFPEAEMLPHLICSRPMFIGGAKDEADQHGGA